MRTYVIILLVLIALCSIFIYEHMAGKSKVKKWLKEHYGKKPKEKDYNFERIGMYWKEFGKIIPEDEKIDDVTWNDLEMNHIFSRINTCCSFVGEHKLYATLHYLPKNETYGTKLEKKIEHFASKPEEREAIQQILFSLGKDDVSYYLPIFINNLDMFGVKGILGYRIMQGLLVLSIFPAIIYKSQSYLILTLAIFIINLLIYAIKKMQYEINMDSLNSIIRLVKAGNKIAQSKRFSYEETFCDLQEKADSFQKLERLVGRIQQKKQASLTGDPLGMVYEYLIGATLWDFTAYNHIIHMLKGKQTEYMELYNKIGEIDMAIAVASFRESLPNFCRPQFCKEHILHMEELYHPLIDEPVCNSIDFDKSCIITGSNASGKSTFIKAVAVNVILAQSINTCMAKKMIIPYAHVITSMAVRDDLMTGESYYIKEIKYLNRIIESLGSERFVICAIDEILRGTNTGERIAASASILNYLSDKNCIAIVASHDIELTQILNGVYDNYHFQEQIMDKDIMFDYKIQEGASTSKNAIKLLEYVGYPDEIIENARKGYAVKSI
jgi:hypothetical protein